jgi:hypothetical protein
MTNLTSVTITPFVEGPLSKDYAKRIPNLDLDFVI